MDSKYCMKLICLTLPEAEYPLPALAALQSKRPSTTAPKYLANHSPLGITLLYESPSLVFPAALEEIMANTPACSSRLSPKQGNMAEPQNQIYMVGPFRHEGCKQGYPSRQRAVPLK